MKTCTKCKENKELTEFYKNKSVKKDRLEYWCKSCCKERANQWCKANPDKHRAHGKTYIVRHQDRIKTHNLRQYGIDITQYNQILKDQQEKCAICDRHKSNFNKDLHVDHCHITGKIRGLLCSNCNTALGLLQENLEIAEKATSYLRKAYETSK